MVVITVNLQKKVYRRLKSTNYLGRQFSASIIATKKELLVNKPESIICSKRFSIK